MRRFLPLALAALALTAVQAQAAKTTAVRAGDRVGPSQAGASQSINGLGIIPTLLLAAGTLALVIGIADNSNSTSP